MTMFHSSCPCFTHQGCVSLIMVVFYSSWPCFTYHYHVSLIMAMFHSSLLCFIRCAIPETFHMLFIGQRPSQCSTAAWNFVTTLTSDRKFYEIFFLQLGQVGPFCRILIPGAFKDFQKNKWKKSLVEEFNAWP